MANNMKVVSCLMMSCVLMMMQVAECTPNTSITNWRCNGDSYSKQDFYADNVEYVLADLMNVTPNAGYDYYTHSPSNSDVAYGHGTCSKALSYNDCADCLTANRASVKDICALRIGGTVEMADCSIRYENYTF